MSIIWNFWHANLGFIGQAIIGVKVPSSSHVASIQHKRVRAAGKKEFYILVASTSLVEVDNTY